MTDEVLTIREVAKLLRITPPTATKIFERQRGVIDLGSAEELHKRQYKILRIPRYVYERVLRERSIR